MSKRSQVWADEELATLAHLVDSDVLHATPRLKTASAKSLSPNLEMCILPKDITAKFMETAN